MTIKSYYTKLSVLLVFFFSFSEVWGQLPEKYAGNWINEQNNQWEYGFFEKFAVYNCDFWNYKSIVSGKKGQTLVTLEKGNQLLNLKLSAIDEKHIAIKSGKAKSKSFVLMEKTYPAYRYRDYSTFPKPQFKSDSATIIGYYRNLDQVPEQFRDRINFSPFTVGSFNFTHEGDESFFTDIDSLGRFKITFPVRNTQEMYVDWRRTTFPVVVEPEDTLFLFADMNDYIPREEDQNYQNYINRPKQVLFMGESARINNEIMQCKRVWNSENLDTDANVTDMDYLQACENVYNKRMAILNQYIAEHPTVSEKFRYYKRNQEKYEFASNLMQRRFHAYRKENHHLEDGYIQFVERNFPLTDETVYTLSREFIRFLNDYLGYKKDVYASLSNTVPLEKIEERLADKNELTDELKAQLDTFMQTVNKMQSAPEYAYLKTTVDSLGKELNNNNAVVSMVNRMSLENRLLDTSVADSIITDDNLKELWTTKQYCLFFDQIHEPLTDDEFSSFKERVRNPDLVYYIENIQNFYKNISDVDVRYQASLKNTEHLKEYKVADDLFEELIKPYRGKVIYVDFWGTWCGPCRTNLQYAGAVEKHFENKDVIFMYFANRSPEETWKNIIKELNLSGENIVHYRLPTDQEAMIERKFSVTGFPTYMLIDENGKVVNVNADPPINTAGAIGQIQALLKP
ncbi:MAG: TlpA disulfide reductase family protein [Paludibacter sp.]|nr:TlpA disulfide reductase family protein [Paludibacter sp.]